MKFEQIPQAEKLFNELLPGTGGMRLYGAQAGYWYFQIAYDLLHNHWGASYRPIHSADVRPIPIGKFFETRDQVEAACRHKYKELKANA